MVVKTISSGNNSKLRLQCLALSLCLIAIAPSAHAQLPEEQVDEFRRATRPIDTGVTGDLFEKPLEMQPPLNAEEIFLSLDSILIEGNTVFSDAELERFWRKYLGQSIPASTIWKIAKDITRFYRDRGYPLTRVIIPMQELANGQGPVRLVVLEGFIHSVSVISRDDAGAPPKVGKLIKQYADRLKRFRPVPFAELERTLLLINDLPGVSATALPRASEANIAGAVDLFITIDHDYFDGVLRADSRRSPALGPGLVGAVGTFNSYSGAGDTTQVGYFNSFSLEDDDENSSLSEQRILQISHRRYVGARGTEVIGNFLYGRSEPSDFLAPLNFEGEQYVVELSVKQPFQRTRRESIWIEAGFRAFEGNSNVFQTLPLSDDSGRAAFVDVQYLRNNIVTGAYLFASAGIQQGLPGIGASDSDEDRIISRVDAEDNYTLFKADLQGRKYMSLGDSIQNIKVDGRLSMQFSSEPLLASDEFTIGGLSYGKAYDPSEFSGDNGIGLEIQVSKDFNASEVVASVMRDGIQPKWTSGIILEPYVFSDYGRIEDEATDTAEVSSAGGGLKARFSQERLNDLAVTFEIAAPLSEPLQRNQSSSPRYFVELAKSF